LLTIIILITFSLIMLWAAYSDLTRYLLPNKLCLAAAALYPIFLLATYVDGDGMPLHDILMSIVIALVIFAVCAGFFALNIMGGGDVKLIPIVALWAGSTHVLPYLFITSLVGGLIAMTIIIINRINRSKYYKSSENINLYVAEKKISAVPYGIGIALGGLFVAYQLFAGLNETMGI